MNTLITLWQRLTTPHPSIESVEQQWQSRILGGFAVVAFFVVLAVGLLYVTGILPRAELALGLAIVMTTGVYMLNRRGYYLLAAYLLVGMFFIIIHLSLLDADRIIIFFGLLLLLTTGIFLSMRAAMAVYTASIVLQIIAAIISPNEYELSYVTPLILMILGGPVVLVFIHFRHVVEQARRDQLLQANAQLTLSEDRWRSLVKNLPDIVIELDPSGIMRYVNIIAPSLSREDVIGKSVTTYVDPKYRVHTENKIAEVISTQKPVDYEVEGQGLDSEQHWYANRLSPVIQHGKVDSLILVSRDITARKKADEQLLEMALLKERVDILQGLIRGYTHDMKTPLATIDFSLSILENVDDTTQQQLELETIRSQSSRLNNLIQNILTLSRLDQLAELERETIDLKVLLESLQQNLLRASRQKNVKIALDLRPDINPILANALELDRAISNIVENAITYSPNEATVQVNAFPDDNYIIIEVVDTGIGIPPDELTNIFKPFYRVQGAPSKPPGTGLGLAIANRIINMHNGDLSVESTVGKDTTFRIRLPMEHANVV